jgi:porin
VLFFTFGASDGNANPIRYSYNFGLGGNGVMESRPHDTFGIGWARTEFGGSFLPFLRQRLDLGLDREDAVEMYYNVAVTGWLEATLDLQIINNALTRTPRERSAAEKAPDDVDVSLRADTLDPIY